MKSLTQNTFLEGIIFAVVGLILLFFPNGTLYLICRILGIALLIMAAYKIYTYASGKNGRQRVDLVIGIALLIFALILMARPSIITNIAPIVFGIIVAAGGVVSFLSALLAQEEGKKKTMGIIAAVLTLGFVLLILLKPSIITGIFVSIIGIGLIIEGISLILTAKR